MIFKNKSFVSACLGLFIAGNVFVSFGTLSVYLKNRFLLDDLSMGSLSAVLSFGILMGSIVFGPIVDRYGYKLLTIISTLIIVSGFELIAAGDSLLLIYIAFILLGIGGGIINGSTTALVADISQEEKGANLSLLHAFYGMGALCMPFATGFLHNYITFERIFFYFGIVILLSILFYMQITFPKPKQPHGLPWKKVLTLLKETPLLFFSFFLFLQSGIEVIINNWTLQYIQNKYVLEMSNLIYVLSFYAIGIIIVRLSFRILLRKSKPVTILLISLCISLSGVFVLWFSAEYLFLLIGIFLVGIGFASIFPIMLAFISEKYSDLSGTALGIAFLFALSGSVTFNLFMGMISKTFGINKYPLILSIVIVFLILLVTKISKLNNKVRKVSF